MCERESASIAKMTCSRDVYSFSTNGNVLFETQLSSLRSGHRRLTGSPTSEEQQSSSQPSPSGASSVSNTSRTSSTDSKSDSTKRSNKVPNDLMIYLYNDLHMRGAICEYWREAI